MKKTAMLLLFAFLSLQAHAEENWQHVTESENEEIRVDVNSIRKVGKYKSAESIINYSVPAKAPGTKFEFISDRSIFFFDCKKKRFGRATQILYSQPDGEGQSLMTFSCKMDDIKFEKVFPETVSEILFNFVCAKNP